MNHCDEFPKEAERDLEVIVASQEWKQSVDGITQIRSNGV